MIDSDESKDSIYSKESSVMESSIITKEILDEEIIIKKFSKRQDKATRLQIEEEQKNESRDKALKAMRYLLNSSELYSGFIKKKLIEEKEHRERDSMKTSKEKGPGRKRKLNDGNKIEEGDIKFSDDKECTQKGMTPLSKQPKYFEGGTLRDYQMDGLVWLKLLYENGLNGILADEMGLGKTIQVIALICHLIEECIFGPFLIIAPLSTIPNWIAEFKRFAPKIPVILFHGNQKTRESLYIPISQKNYLVDGKKVAPVVITTFQIPLVETKFLQRFLWKFLIVDEGQRIKNHESQLAIVLSNLKSSNRLILTGTPLQNNLKELWALLNFLVPQIFPDSRMFTSLFELDDFQNLNKIIVNEEQTQIISTLHQILAPFMLRRLKSDVLTIHIPKKEVSVYCPVTKHQYLLYQAVLDYNIERILNKEKEIDVNTPRQKRQCTIGKENPSEILQMKFNELMEYYTQKEASRSNKPVTFQKPNVATRITMTNPPMMLRKILNHPYLVQMPIKYNASDEAEILIDENLIKQSGKMMVLDALVTRLKKAGHKVLIFSTFTMMLDLIEEYFLLRNFQYVRLDGSKHLNEREVSINEFNNDPNIFAFLISTRAGGLGLNLIAADTVIIYDSDWNPQADIQAQDRCHRIGQTKPVVVYRLVAKDTYDENIISCAKAKRCLEKVIICNEEFNYSKVSDFKKLKSLIKFQAEETIHTNGFVLSDRQLKYLLDRKDLWKEMKNNSSEENTSENTIEKLNSN